jgi:argininosuccinate lyase
MKLWDKGEPLDALVATFTVGDDPITDLAWAWHDVVGSAAHVRAQLAAGLLDRADADALLAGLATVAADIEAGRFTIAAEQEDVHTAVESLLTARIGPVAGKLHTGRSRNDQVLLDLRLWLVEELGLAESEWRALATAWLDFADRHADVPLPGYTHLQRAMPSSWGLWAAGFAGALLDVLPLLTAARTVVARSPLGSAAGYGTPLPLDRAATATLLGLSGVVEPVTAAQLERGLVEGAALGALAAACHVVGRWAGDVCLYATAEFGLLRLPAAFTTGSSIMPQKRNPDVAELLRGQARRVRAAQREIEDLSAALPSGYHRDLQHTKAPLLRGVTTARLTLRVATHLAAAVEPRVVPLDDGLFAAAEAFRRARAEGRPFREVYKDVGAEVSAGTFTAVERAPAPAPDLAGLRARATAGGPAASGTELRERWRRLLDPTG